MNVIRVYCIEFQNIVITPKFLKRDNKENIKKINVNSIKHIKYSNHKYR